MTRESLMRQGFLQPLSEPVYRTDEENQPLLDQRMPFRKLFMPYAQTGFYEPERPVFDPNSKEPKPYPEYRGQIIFMPGIGATISHAGRILDVVGTFHGHRSKNRGSGEKSHDHFEKWAAGDVKWRMASYALDVTLNGLGDGAPLFFATEAGSIEVLRHLHLILKILNPHLKDKVFLAGRSQGGLIGMSYIQKYKDALGVVAVNPSSSRQDVVDASLRVGDAGSPGVFTGFKTSLHPRAWKAYKLFTPHFEAFDHTADTPALIMLSSQDSSYHDELLPREVYEEHLRSYVDAQSGRRLLSFDYGHDLWVYRNNPHFDAVVKEMAQFFVQALAQPSHP